MVLDPSIITNGVTQGLAIQQRNIEQMQNLGGALGQLVLGQKANKMRQMQTPEEQQAYANKSLFSPYLNQILKADQTAAAKAAAEKLKFDAELAKLKAETGKIDSETTENGAQTKKIGIETTGLDLGNSQKRLDAAYQAISIAAKTGDPNAIKLALNNSLKAGSIDDGLYQQISGQIDSFNNNPAKIKEFAQSIVLGQTKDQAQYLFQTENNKADNETSTNNNVRSTNAQIYGINKTAETADENRAVQEKRLAFEKQQLYFQQNKPTAYGVDVNGRKYAVLANGKSVYVKDENGNYVIEQVKSGNGGGLTEQQSKDALFGARMQEANKIISTLEGEGVKAPVMNSLPYGDKLSNALPSILGGASVKQQQYVQAQRDFINAVLRKESGAVIADSEFENAQKQYFPQIGDSEDVIAQKAKNRELAMKMIVNGSGVQGKALINSATNSQGQLQPGQVPSSGAGGSSLSFYK